MNNETDEQRAARILEEARTRLRGVSAQLVQLAPPADVAGIFLVQALAILNLERDAKACVEWLRTLADHAEILAVVHDGDLATLNAHDLN